MTFPQLDRSGRPRCTAIAVAVGSCLLSACAPGFAPPDPATGGSPGNGRKLLVAYGCVACHTVGGIGEAQGRVGPPLVNAGARAYLGGVLANTPRNMQRWIMHPQQFSPKTAMPDLGVTEAQARDITAYLYQR
jgi:cytochrome c2